MSNDKLEITIIATPQSGILSSMMRTLGSHGLIYRKMKSEPCEDNMNRIKIIAEGQLNVDNENLISSIESIAGIDRVASIISQNTHSFMTENKGTEGTLLSQDSITPEIVQFVEKRLANIMGLVAIPLVRKAAGKSDNIGQLFLSLGGELDSEEEFSEFMSITDLDHADYEEKQNKRTVTSIQKEDLGQPKIQLGAHDSLTPVAIQVAEYRLSKVLGPAASVLVKSAASKTKHVGDFFLLLADDLDGNEREAFLSIVGGINLAAL